MSSNSNSVASEPTISQVKFQNVPLHGSNESITLSSHRCDDFNETNHAALLLPRCISIDPTHDTRQWH